MNHCPKVRTKDTDKVKSEGKDEQNECVKIKTLMSIQVCVLANSIRPREPSLEMMDRIPQTGGSGRGPVMKPPRRGRSQTVSDKYDATIHLHSDHDTPETLPATRTRITREHAFEKFKFLYMAREETWIMVPDEETTKPPPLDTTTKVQSGETMLFSSQREFDLDVRRKDLSR